MNHCGTATKEVLPSSERVAFPHHHCVRPCVNRAPWQVILYSRLTKLVNIIKSKARPCSQPVRLQGKSGGFTDPKYKGLSNKYIQIWG